MRHVASALFQEHMGFRWSQVQIQPLPVSFYPYLRPVRPEITRGCVPFSNAPAHFFTGRIWISLGLNRGFTT